MMKRRTVVMSIALVGLVVFLCAAWWFAFASRELRLSREEIQEKLDTVLPHTKDGTTVERAVILLADDQLRVHIFVSGKRMLQTFSLEAHTVGVPHYEPSNGSFYFTPTTVEVVRISHGESGASIGEKLKEAAKRYVPQSQGTLNLATNLGDKVDEWFTRTAEKSALYMLARMPVYTLKDDAKGILTKAVIEDVHIEGDELVIGFTLWRLTGLVITWTCVALLCVGILIVLFRNPKLFLGVAEVIAEGIAVAVD